MDLRAVLEASDFIRRLTGVKVESLYNKMLRYGFTAIVNPMLPMMHLLGKVCAGRYCGAIG